MDMLSAWRIWVRRFHIWCSRKGCRSFRATASGSARSRRVERDIATHIFDGIIFTTAGGIGGRRFVDAPEVGEIHEGGVILTIDAKEAGELPSPRGVA